jgi:hypothetical protein
MYAMNNTTTVALPMSNILFLSITTSLIQTSTPRHSPYPISLLAVTKPARRSVKGEQSSAAQRRTLDGPHRAPVTLADANETERHT